MNKELRNKILRLIDYIEDNTLDWDYSLDRESFQIRDKIMEIFRDELK